MWYMLFVILCFLLVLDEALLLNSALIKGQPLKQECKIDATAEFLSWVFIRSGTNNEQTVLTENKGIADNYKARVNISNGSRVLMIASVQLEDAGVYGCKNKRNSSVDIERAEVVVLDGSIKMSRINSSHVSCKATYNGNWLPTIELIQSGPNGSETNFENYVKHNDVSSIVMATASLTPDSNSSISTFHCRLYFGNKSTAERVVTNIPTYSESIVCIFGPSEDNCSLTMPETLGTPGPSIYQFNAFHILYVVIGVVSLCLIVILIVVCVKKNRALMNWKLKSSKKLTAGTEPDLVLHEDNSSGIVGRPPEILQHQPSLYATVYAANNDVEHNSDDQAAKRNRYVAADGTEYLRMNNAAKDEDLSSRKPPAPPPSAFPLVVYASIDHTIQAPNSEEPKRRLLPSIPQLPSNYKLQS